MNNVFFIHLIVTVQSEEVSTTDIEAAELKQIAIATDSTVNFDDSTMVSAVPITQNEVAIAKQGTYHYTFEDFCIEYNE